MGRMKETKLVFGDRLKSGRFPVYAKIGGVWAQQVSCGLNDAVSMSVGSWWKVIDKEILNKLDAA